MSLFEREIPYAQRSPEWLALRNQLITASDVSSILECGYGSAYEVFQRKKVAQQAAGQEVGQAAGQIIGQSVGQAVEQHTRETEWGITYEPYAKSLFCQKTNLAVRDVSLIKHREIPWLAASPDGVIFEGNQLVGLLEIKCPFKRRIIPGHIPKYYWIQVQIQMEVCDIDICYFYQWNNVLDDVIIIHRDRQWFMSIYHQLLNFYNNLQQENNPYTNWAEWINYRDLYNYYRGDSILDWLNIYKTLPFQINTTVPLDEPGIQASNTDIQVFDSSEVRQLSRYQRTKYLIETQTPIIEGAVIWDTTNKIYGYIDFLVLSDQLVLNPKKKTINEYIALQYHSSIPVVQQGIKDPSVNALATLWKGPIYIISDKKHNTACGRFRDYYLYQCIIDCDPNSIVAYRKWQSGNWVLDGVLDPRLWPNMKNDHDYPWHGLKVEFAKHLGEITLLWQCGLSNRLKAFDQGIRSWKTDSFNAEICGFKGERAAIINNIIQANRTQTNIINKIKLPKNPVYVDFETADGFIFMIGIGQIVDQEWIFETIIADRLDPVSEKNILTEFMLKTIDRPIIHWSAAERIQYSKAALKYDLQELAWFDLCAAYMKTKTALYGAFNYSIKTLAKAAKAQGLIESIWTDSMTGLEASLTATNVNKKLEPGESLSKYLRDIIVYNELDCKIMYELGLLLD